MSTQITLDQGDRAEITATFTDPDSSAAVTPTSVYFAYEAPDGTVTTLVYGVDAEVTLVAAGVYRLAINCDQAGIYQVRSWSTGTGKAAETGRIVVRRNPIRE